MPLLSSIGPGDKEALRQRLTALQYAVTQEQATEPPFQNEYWGLEEEGLYVDVISGEPLFSSRHKLRTADGWPGFSRPVMDASVKRPDGVELFARESGGYLGMLKQQGNQAYYSINSAALRFIPLKQLAAEGYEDMIILFRIK
ncbi:peptide-methionine (R)-S-oxide reductase [Ectobacillus ponti]|uniref:peptide-methionine (R)-S-oxide reductase n=1 Tax=Ectobacillus ponti TaxID=2961894 RepID=UPI003F668FCF